MPQLSGPLNDYNYMENGAKIHGGADGEGSLT